MKTNLCGYEILIDADEVWRIGKYEYHAFIRSVNGHVYFKRYTYSNGKSSTAILHREIASAEKGQLVDHRDRNSLNLRKSNLRVCDNLGNSRNCGIRKDNISGFKGVGYSKANHAYRARIRIGTKRLFLGYFQKPENAYSAYCEAAKKYHGDFAAI